MKNLILAKVLVTGQEVHPNHSCSNIFSNSDDKILAFLWVFRVQKCFKYFIIPQNPDPSVKESSASIYLILVNSTMLIVYGALSSTQKKRWHVIYKKKERKNKKQGKKKSFIFIPDKIMPSPENEVLVHSCRAPEE